MLYRELQIFIFCLYVENIFTVYQVPRLKGGKNDKMLKPQLDSNCLQCGVSCIYPHYRQLPSCPPLGGSSALWCRWGWGRDATYFVYFVWPLEHILTVSHIHLL